MRALALLAAGAVFFGCKEEIQDSAINDSATQEANARQSEIAAALEAETRPPEIALDGPRCDDGEVIDFVVDAFNAVQDFETRSGVSLTALSKITDLGATTAAEGDWRQIRNCAARAALSTGRTISSWHQIRLPLIEDAIGYRVKVCFAEYDPVSGGDCSKFDGAPS